jgi:hypothetical protein
VTIDQETVVFVGGWVATVVTAVIYVVRLEGRIMLLEQRVTSAEKALDDHRASITAQLSEGFRKIEADLGKIFDRLEGKADKIK